MLPMETLSEYRIAMIKKQENVMNHDCVPNLALHSPSDREPDVRCLLKRRHALDGDDLQFYKQGSPCKEAWCFLCVSDRLGDPRSSGSNIESQLDVYMPALTYSTPVAHPRLEVSRHNSLAFMPVRHMFYTFVNVSSKHEATDDLPIIKICTNSSPIGLH